MEKIIINVFGHDIKLDPKASIITMEKVNEVVVTIKMQSQSFMEAQNQVNVKEKYGKTADEFISEFKKNVLKVKQASA